MAEGAVLINFLPSSLTTTINLARATLKTLLSSSRFHLNPSTGYLHCSASSETFCPFALCTQILDSSTKRQLHTQTEIMSYGGGYGGSNGYSGGGGGGYGGGGGRGGYSNGYACSPRVSFESPVFLRVKISNPHFHHR